MSDDRAAKILTVAGLVEELKIFCYSNRNSHDMTMRWLVSKVEDVMAVAMSVRSGDLSDAERAEVGVFRLTEIEKDIARHSYVIKTLQDEAANMKV